MNVTVLHAHEHNGDPRSIPKVKVKSPGKKHDGHTHTHGQYVVVIHQPQSVRPSIDIGSVVR